MSLLTAQTEARRRPLLAEFEPARRDAVRGLNDFAAFLDGQDLPEATTQTRISDFIVIALAWAVLALMFYVPHMQLMMLALATVGLGIKAAFGRRHREPVAVQLAPQRGTWA